MALRTPVTIGTNVKDQLAGGTWTFLLPSLELDRVLLIGAPSEATVETLRRLARQVREIDHPRQDDRLPPADGPFDLVWMIAERAGARMELAKRLSAGGVVVAEGIRPPWSGRASSPPPALEIELRPLAGEVASAFVAGDARAAGWLRDRGLAGPSLRLPGRIGRQVARLIDREPVRRLLPVRTVMATGPGIAPEGQAGPPTYLRSLAARAGIQLEGWRWALAVPGRYRTQKVLWLLAPPDAAEPTLVVKLTRDPSANERLEIERDALRALAEVDVGLGDRAPRVLFAGRHAGLAVVGETAVTGRPLRSVMAANGGEALVDDAIDWLGRLGERTARQAPGPEVAAPLAELLARFRTVHTVEGEELRVLGDAVDRIAAADHLPLVFEHGDAGVWNMIATPAGRVALLDWENATPLGMPAWDLIYLLRSIAVGGRVPGRRRIDAAAAAWLPGSPIERRLRAGLPRYCAQVGLERELVPALFQLCWMFHALKEASRMRPDRLAQGHYRRLLRRTIADRDRLLI